MRSRGCSDQHQSAPVGRSDVASDTDAAALARRTASKGRRLNVREVDPAAGIPGQTESPDDRSRRQASRRASARGGTGAHHVPLASPDPRMLMSAGPAPQAGEELPRHRADATAPVVAHNRDTQGSQLTNRSAARTSRPGVAAPITRTGRQSRPGQHPLTPSGRRRRIGVRHGTHVVNPPRAAACAPSHSSRHAPPGPRRSCADRTARAATRTVPSIRSAPGGTSPDHVAPRRSADDQQSIRRSDRRSEAVTGSVRLGSPSDPIDHGPAGENRHPDSGTPFATGSRSGCARSGELRGDLPPSFAGQMEQGRPGGRGQARIVQDPTARCIRAARCPASRSSWIEAP